MDDPRSLDDEYVRKHARPGEDWDEARRRLKSEIAKRYSQLPGCVTCSQSADSVDHARETHRIVGLGTCLGPDEKWPAAALEPELFEQALAEHQHRTEDLAAIARGHVKGLLAHMRHQDYPINALMISQQAEGYLKSCRDLGLFEPAELLQLQQELHEGYQRARGAFMQQFRDNDQGALPWR